MSARSVTFESDFAFTSNVILLFFITDWISPKIKSLFFVPEAVIACNRSRKDLVRKHKEH